MKAISVSLFKVWRANQVTFIECPEILNMSAAKEFEALGSYWVNAPDLLYVLNFSKVKEVDHSFYHSVAKFKTGLNRSRAYLCTVDTKENLRKKIERDGVGATFSFQDSVEEFLKANRIEIPQYKLAIDVGMIKPFLDHTVQAVSVQAKTSVKPGKIYKVDRGELVPADIAGIMEIEGPEFKGTATICFSAQVAQDIYFNMIGERHSELNDDIKDCVKEILNIAMGRAAAELTGKQRIKRAFPEVVTGTELKLRHNFRMPVLVIPFFTDSGPFHFEISTEQQLSWAEGNA